MTALKEGDLEVTLCWSNDYQENTTIISIFEAWVFIIFPCK